jgi:hypothetical protein
MDINFMKPKTNLHIFNNLCPILQDPRYIQIKATNLLMLRREMFTIYNDRDKEPTGRGNTKKTGNGEATGNSKKFC